MSLGLTWINSRKTLIITSISDFLLFFFIFFFTFNEFISENFLIIFLSLFNSFCWIVSSYITGRYIIPSRFKSYLFINHFLKTIIVLFLNLISAQIVFRIFWDWDIINFESFTNFIDNFVNCLGGIFILSTILQLSIILFFLKVNTKKRLWIFWGTTERQTYFKSLLNKKPNIKVNLINIRNVDIGNCIAKGIIIDDEEDFARNNISFLFGLNKKGMKFIKISTWCEKFLNRCPSDLIKSSEIINGNFIHNEKNPNSRIKRIGEAIISLLILIITFPILIVSSILIKLQDGGPIFYSQIRNGFEGKQFKIIKLRTMIINAEKNGEQWAESFDKRITKVGYILRKLRIDELPQLLLVLTGEMSLIGPRPERPSIEKRLREKIPYYDLRYSIKPGITGWAQVNFPYGASIEDSRNKLSYDLFYIKNLSILLDLIILLMTIRIVLNGKGSKPNQKSINKKS